MGVKLDWDIEAEKGKRKEHKEDFKERSARYLGLFRLLMIILFFLAILGGAAYAIIQRLEQVNSRIEQILSETVQAEIASLRVGDFDGFINIQRSASEDWLISQRQIYEDYQQLKSSSNIILSGQVISLEVDGQRGRIQVQEIIDGVPYLQTWFYWRYEEGWYHVPPDYTFWGEASRIESQYFVIRYQTVDELLAQSVANELESWLNDACSFFACNNLPPITIDILPQALAEIQWAENEQNIWQLIIPSPYLARAREDMPFDRQMQIDAATLLANRLLDFASNNVSVTYPSDAFYLRSGIVTWLVGRFVQINTESYLITSLSSNYNTNTISSLLAELQSTSTLEILNTVTAVPFTDANLDWRDFVLWRLNTEDELIQSGDEATWAQLYDFRDENLLSIARSRYNNNFTANERFVLEVNRVLASDGTVQLVARVQVTRGFESGEEIVVFSYFNGTWLRVN
jgi:hypothetical protein